MTLQKSRTRSGGICEGQLTLFVEDSPVKPLALQENAEDFQILEELCFSRSQEPLKKSNHGCYCLRMSEGYYLTRKGRHLLPSYPRWMNWGTMRNGKCLTQKIMESPSTENECTLLDILEENVEEKYFLSEEQTKRLLTSIKDEQIKNLLSVNKGKVVQVGQIYGTEKEPNPQAGRIYSAFGISPTLGSCQGGNRMPKIAISILTDQDVKILIPSVKYQNKERGINYRISDIAPTITTGKGEGSKIVIPILTPDRKNKHQNGRRFKNPGEEMFTLTAQDRHGVALVYQRSRGHNKGGLHAISPTLTSNDWQNNNFLIMGFIVIRKLTPRECWRLQAFPDEFFDKAQAVNSDSQLYKQAGNSVTVNVVYEIAKKIKEMEEETSE